jgi:hypothetical protein
MRARLHESDARLRWIAEDRAAFTAITDAMLDACWNEVVDHWDRASAHEAFVALCRRQSRPREPWTRYKALAGRDAVRASDATERAKKTLHPSTLASMELARRPQAPRAAPSTRWTPTWWHVALFAVLALLAVLMILSRP